MVTTRKKLFICFLVLFLFLQVLAEASLDHDKELLDGKGRVAHHKIIHHTPKINCHFACARRCRKASRKNVCNRACGTCCSRCQCVPFGTYGNKNSCPCYASLRTHGRKPKCPSCLLPSQGNVNTTVLGLRFANAVMFRDANQTWKKT